MILVSNINFQDIIFDPLKYLINRSHQNIECAITSVMAIRHLLTAYQSSLKWLHCGQPLLSLGLNPILSSFFVALLKH